VVVVVVVAVVAGGGGCLYEEGRVGPDFVGERANGRVVEGEGHESFLHVGEGHELLQQRLPVVPHYRRICTRTHARTLDRHQPPQEPPQE
jgi:hypothetical protein